MNFKLFAVRKGFLSEFILPIARQILVLNKCSISILTNKGIFYI